MIILAFILGFIAGASFVAGTLGLEVARAARNLTATDPLAVARHTTDHRRGRGGAAADPAGTRPSIGSLTSTLLYLLHM